ncbi:MAG TPA: hypothetical protein PLC07_08715 [Bacillota bacterium]|nr:hypothetical protein [Bacillota bacterium]HPT88027.1 hypothetical protein [Bacillota bacterium]
MTKKLITLLTLAFLLITGTQTVLGNDLADDRSTKDYSVGWQYSRPMYGLAVKIPVSEGYFIQPVLSFNTSEDNTSSKGWYSAGLRAFINLPKREDFQPYTGIGAGHYKQYRETNHVSTDSSSSNSYEAFIGFEYQKYVIRPSVEIAMGSYTKKNGDHFGGFSLNVGLAYSF